PANDYGVETQVGDVEGFIDALALKSPLLVGQSMGGLNSMAYAVRHSELMKALVVVDVGPEVNPAGTQRIREFASTPELDSPQALPQARWIRVENAGHNVQGDNPRGLLDAMNPWLREAGL